MKLNIALLAAAFSLGTASAANAQVTATFADGLGLLSPSQTSFATFSGGNNGGVTGNFIIQTGSNNLGAAPAVGDIGDPYLSVLAGQTASFSFAGLGGISQLGLDYGSADSYNLFELLLLGGGSAVFNGQDLINSGTADGNQSAPRTNGRLTFNAGVGTTIVGLNLRSFGNSLETDNYGIVRAVPEPGTWAMMLLGFSVIGFGMRRKRSSHLSQIA